MPSRRTPRSLRYLIEECYELVGAIEAGDPAAIREELGDVLLQVLFHARIAAETPAAAGGFDIDDVAGDLVDKLVRRHPHVFDAAAAPVSTAADQQRRWDELKKTEQGRSGVLDGVAFGQPAAALSAKLGSRAAKFDLRVEPSSGESPAQAMFRIAYAAGARGEDPESALRAVAIAHARRAVGGRACPGRGDRPDRLTSRLDGRAGRLRSPLDARSGDGLAQLTSRRRNPATPAAINAAAITVSTISGVHRTSSVGTSGMWVYGEMSISHCGSCSSWPS